MGWPLYPHMKRHVASLVREFSSSYALAYQQGKLIGSIFIVIV